MQAHPIDVMEAWGVKLVAKAESRLMRFVNWLMFWNDDFMTTFFTTITLPGFRRIYYPSSYTAQSVRLAIPILWHELEHVEQADGPPRYKIDSRWIRWPCNIAFAILYLSVFLPIGLAYFRMRWETDAYAVGYVARVRLAQDRWGLEAYADWVANGIFTAYAFAWPKPWTRARFLRRVAELTA